MKLYCSFTLSIVFAFLPYSCRTPDNISKIDRFKLVNRHNILHRSIDSLNSLTVGNGEFAFTVGITGLQSFPEFYEKGIPLGTQSQWGWHCFPNPENYSLSDVYKMYKAGNDSIPYIFQYTNDPQGRKNKASQWLRENPHRMHLGIIGLEFYINDSTTCLISDIKNPVQQLNLWKGEIRSNFQINGIPVEVITYCHQELDMISVQINSRLLQQEKIKIKIRFPYATHEKFSPAYDLGSPEMHVTQIVDKQDNGVTFSGKSDNNTYYTKLTWNSEAELKNPGQHTYYLCPKNYNSFEFSCLFSEEDHKGDLPDFKHTAKNNMRNWEQFWKSGGVVDFSACTDPRAFELERRVILSQYLTKIQCSGSLPPQETGLTYNSWHGKFHLEMHWWHGIHFILWNRAELIEKQMNYYFDIYDLAQKTTEYQGYNGVRWPKMVGPAGRESPSTIGTFLIWQQPHIIYFSELLYNYHNQDKAILNKYKSLVFATADFMASYVRLDDTGEKYILGPPLIPAQERFAPETTVNPAFELAYWYWGLKTAQKWRQRLGMAPSEKWQDAIENLAGLPVKDSLYLFTEDATDSYTNPEYMTDHPMVLGIMGLLPESEKTDKRIMKNTMEKIINCWDWQSIWGWDIPMAAMNATILDDPEQAIEFLFMDTRKNTFLTNGHNYQDETLTIYLPGNGGLLTAIAMMCTYRNENHDNGFPSNGKWNVRYENLNKLHY